MPKVYDWTGKFGTADFTQSETRGAALWDRQLYTSATTLTMQFFTAVRNVLRDGNIEIASQLSSGVHFLVQAIRVIPIIRPDQRIALLTTEGAAVSVADDLAQLYNDGVFTLRILQKVYAQFPLFLLLPGTGIVANQATFTTSAQTSNYVVAPTVGNPDNRAVYTLAQPLAIPSLTTIRCQIDWAAAVTLEAGNMNLEVVLDGQEIRPKQ
jgi:hypothetical protein